MAYDGQTVVDLDRTRPDGDAEPKSILDDVTKEIKRAILQTQYSWSNFENQVGAPLTVGAVVSLGPTGLIQSDTSGSFLKYVVAVEAIAPNAIGLVAREGPVLALTAGSVTALNYVRKSGSAFAVEDMGLSCTPTNVIPNGAIGFSLESVGGAGLCNIFLFEQTSMFPISLANHVMLLTNRTGNILQAGESVTTDPNNDLSVTTNDTVSSFEPTLIAFESIPNITLGRFIHNGVTPVITVGPVSRNHYLRKSATSKVLESTGLSTADVMSPPPGTVGVALTPAPTSGTNTIQALMFGSTVTMPAMSNSAITGLICSNTATSMTVNAFKATLINPINNSTVTITVSQLICQIGIHGRNGRDQSAPFNPNNWINLYYTWNGVSLATRFSLNNPGLGPVLADGETHFVFIGSVRINSFGVMELVLQRDAVTHYLGAKNILSGGISLSETSLTINHLIPPDATDFNINAWGSSSVLPPNTVSIHDFELRHFSGSRGNTARLALSESLDQVVGPVQRSRIVAGFGFSATIINTGYLAYLWTIFGHFPDSYGAEVYLTGYTNRR